MDINILVGRFHPLIVHLPIGFLILAILFKGMEVKKKTSDYRSALMLILLLSSVAAIFACISGYLLSRTSSYPDNEISIHMWAGIVLAIITTTWYFLEKSSNNKPILKKGIAGLAGVLVMITGHWGGNLTHGKGYLLQGLPPGVQKILGHTPNEAEKLEFNISNIDSTAVYDEIVQPILEARCYSCHSDRKQKGELRLDSPENILNGGESGDPLVAKKIEESKLHHTLTLPLNDDLHMPPKGKTQLTEYEIAAISSWAAQGGDFNKIVLQLEDQTAVRSWYEDQISDQKLFANPLIPNEPAPNPDIEAIESLENQGVLVQPVGTNSNFLDVSFINVPKIDISTLASIESLRDNIIWIDLSGHNISKQFIERVIQLHRITHLDLAYDTLQTGTLAPLSSLSNIRILNLTGAIVEDDLATIGKIESLEKIFTYQSSISREAITSFINKFPQIKVDTGGYTLPPIPADTVIYKFERE
ncbi:c-type cytochrome domain-containing protein [Membranihabitans maritimus]|uniref:c-type cytochrome domain-containing protein n=1 Tax=Membranihabitans maritimus TaxID=2904244 RepID=UPI001F2B2876|nr:c-type cytochrome domain-containing protein [Membranihabitans maritimus]